MKTLILWAMVAMSFLGGCASQGTSTTPVSAVGAQTVGRDQGGAQATESNTATNHNTPVIVNAFAAKKVTVTMADGKPSVEVEGAENAEVEIVGAQFGSQTFGDDGMQAEVSSGGGAAGGVGGASREGGSTVTGTVVPATTPPTGGGQ